VNLRKFVLSSPSRGFDSGKLNYILVIVRRGLGSRETRLFVGTSTEMQATFVVSQTLGINLLSLVHACFDLLFVLAQVHSCLEFDLTLGVIPSD
jgi:hypothetical protein